MNRTYRKIGPIVFWMVALPLLLLTVALVAQLGGADPPRASAAWSLTNSAALAATKGTVLGFANGSFEFDYWSWAVAGNQAVVSGAFWVATNGVKAVAFNVGQLPANGVLSRTFATSAGQRYALTFDLGAISDVNQHEQRLEVRVQGQATLPLFRQTVSVFAPGHGAHYLPQSFTFTADGPATTLTFTDRSPTTINVDLMLDNVRMTVAGAPPSPAITPHPQDVLTAAGSSALRNGVVVSNAVGVATSNAALPAMTDPRPPTRFTNGSFEGHYAGWSGSGNQGVVSGGFWATAHGFKALAFNGGQTPPNAVLSQTFATTAGQTYTLTFDLGAISSVNQTEQRMQVTVHGQDATPLVSRTEAVVAPGNGTRYVTRSFTFVADGPSATLMFRDVSLTSLNVDMMLDNVRITP